VEELADYGCVTRERLIRRAVAPREGRAHVASLTYPTAPVCVEGFLLPDLTALPIPDQPPSPF
jgi:hypothetical protein